MSRYMAGHCYCLKLAPSATASACLSAAAAAAAVAPGVSCCRNGGSGIPTDSVASVTPRVHAAVIF